MATYLADHGATVEQLSKPHAFAAQKKWSAVFGRFAEGTPCRHGTKAVAEWLSVQPGEFLILFLSARVTAFPVSQNSRPCLVLSLHGSPVDVSDFQELEFAITPITYDWTLVHTHEDWSLGGPYFVLAADIDARDNAR